MVLTGLLRQGDKVRVNGKQHKGATPHERDTGDIGRVQGVRVESLGLPSVLVQYAPPGEDHNSEMHYPEELDLA